MEYEDPYNLMTKFTQSADKLFLILKKLKKKGFETKMDFKIKKKVTILKIIGVCCIL